MNRNNTIFIFLLLLQMAFAQEDKLISGKIIVKDATPEGVHVVNLVNEKEAITNAKGEFVIMAKTDDVLIFSNNNLDYMRKIIEAEDYKSGNIEIEMTSKINQLDEVEIDTYKRINAVDLGILKKMPKSYTPAERRLKTATDLDMTLGAGTMVGAALSIDPLLNWLSGRTALLKSELEVEKREILIKKLSDLYEDSYFTETLKIPAEYISAFKYYCAENEKIATAINTKNQTMTSFLLADLALAYNKLLNDEEK